MLKIGVRLWSLPLLSHLYHQQGEKWPKPGSVCTKGILFFGCEINPKWHNAHQIHNLSNERLINQKWHNAHQRYLYYGKNETQNYKKQTTSISLKHTNLTLKLPTGIASVFKCDKNTADCLYHLGSCLCGKVVLDFVLNCLEQVRMFLSGDNLP